MASATDPGDPVPTVRLRIVLVDDQQLVRAGLSFILSTEPDVDIVAEVSNGELGVHSVAAHRPDVVLMDIRMPVMDGIEATGLIGDRAKVLVLTYAEDVDIIARAIRAGASGYLVHGRFTPEDLAAAITTIHRGGTVISPTVAPALFDLVRSGSTGDRGHPRADAQLTEREVEVMDEIITGRSNAEIAERLFLSEKTVKNHINRA
jgi:DNA-binding NarL/FixJ family response regulator